MKHKILTRYVSATTMCDITFDKKGFSNSRAKWFRNAKFKELIFDIINSGSFKNRGYFDSNNVTKQYQKFLDEKADISKEIWKWVNLEIWFRKFIDK